MKVRVDNSSAKKGPAKMAKPLIVMVPGAGIEPAQPLGPRDFKSLASTNSATQAFDINYILLSLNSVKHLDL